MGHGLADEFPGSERHLDRFVGVVTARVGGRHVVDNYVPVLKTLSGDLQEIVVHRAVVTEAVVANEIAEVVDYDVYDEHYNMSDEEQKTSKYAKAVQEIIGLLESEKTKVFAGVKLSPDFKIYAAGHEY